VTIAAHLESRTKEIGRELFARVRRSGDAGGPWWDRWLMDLSMRDERVKAQLFRFIDVLPGLGTATEVNRHLREYLGPVRRHLPMGLGHAVGLIPERGLLGRGLARLAKSNARRMARRFIAATDLPEAIAAVEAMRRRKLAFTIDLLGEAALSAGEAERYQAAYLHLIDGLTKAARGWTTVTHLDRDDRRAIPRVNVSVKLSSLYSQFDPIDPDGTSRAVRQRLRPILRLARERGAFVNVDMEQHAWKDLTLQIFREVFSEPEFRDWPDVGIAIQAYLKSVGEDLQGLAGWARERGTPVWVRLVKGAYWDYETIVAAQNGWPVPVFGNKAATDASFEAQSEFLFAHHDILRPAIASHNIRSLAHALALAERYRLPPRSFEFQMLYGMADPIKSVLAETGHRVRVYTPYGQLLPGMAYLVRRLLENTSNESFLRAGFLERQPEEQLLTNPLDLLQQRSAATTIRPGSNGNGDGALVRHPLRGGRGDVGVELRADFMARPDAVPNTDRPFRNEPLSDFSRAEPREAMRMSLKLLEPYVGASYPLVIWGQKVETGRWIESHDPSHRQRLVGRAAMASVDHATAAVEAARASFPGWRDTPPARRAALLRKVAEVLRRRRFELAAWEVMETAKPWRESDADVAEAIDFCEYYAAEMLRLAEPRRSDAPGESNETFYEPRGVAVVIAPWNFPLAILTGMAAAALVAGNTVVMKPAEQSPVIAAKLMEAFEESGLPPGVVNYLPGGGEEIGPALVRHPDVSLIAFTGSRAVGLTIQRQAAEVSDGQDHIKRVITELGGKNAVIVDDDADLDEAVHGVVASAFGYAGQKCSAASRAIVLGGVYDAFLARLVEATRSLKVGPAEDPGTTVPPVIDDEARERILGYIERGRAEARLVYAADVGELAGEGSYVGPHVFADVAPGAAIAREEIFGPVLAVLKARDLDEALALANDTKYALTGGLFSRSPANIDRARREFRVGNLYVNRKITGALVDRQPFGGFKLSGTGPKAGGPDYLPQFMVARTITENTLRRGFAPADAVERPAQAAGE
jgi:RHH-type proline utilization regulon transcriptional repressor/proline dehydrogenase/delta 1-pyrroline-5-carboxylate dehydrogenase